MVAKIPQCRSAGVRYRWLDWFDLAGGMREAICETCGAKVVEYKHGLSKGLVRTLYIIAKAEPPGQPVAMADLKLTYSQRCNSQKLRYLA